MTTTIMDKPDEEQISVLQAIALDTNNLGITEAVLREAVDTLQPIAAGIPGALDFASRCVVATASDAEAAAKARDEIIEAHQKAVKTINEFGGGLISRLHALHRRWTAFRNLFDPLDSAAKQIKRKIIDFQEAEQKKAEEEQRRLQAEADERARKERERLEKEAAKLKTPEKKEERLEAAAAVVAPVIRVAAPVVAVKTQKRWCVARIDRAAFLTAAATNPMLQGYVTINEQALARSKAANSMLEIPGVTFEQRAV